MKQAIVMTCVLVVIGWFWLFPRPQVSEVQVDQGPVSLEIIKVTIKGAVVFPGIYHFFGETTVREALAYAGGLKEDADASTLRMSEVINGNKTINVGSVNIDVETSFLLININTASFKELLEVPGITEKRAASLIIYREQHGDFQTLDDLINVKNIGVVTLEKIKPHITVG